MTCLLPAKVLLNCILHVWFCLDMNRNILRRLPWRRGYSYTVFCTFLSIFKVYLQ